ncbi:hypothetical protein VNO78_20409 [Psophocarpus tetragonolobus]|uniref:Uncharacterized protein n=1 Tax=Psophocarpus tetragonolobus TaxID=3891 RepID=A0AAN9SDB7_PSOTE
MLKPYICPLSLPFTTHAIPISLRLSQSHPTPITVCAKRHSILKILHLASTVAFNLKILPEPFNSLAGEFARGESDTLSLLVAGRRGKVTSSRRVTKKKSLWFAFFLICVAGALWSWRIREFDLFLRALSFCLAAISLLRLWLGKKAFREWLLGFFFGIVLILSSRLGKEDVKFWVHRIAVPQTVIRKRNRNWRIFK